MCKIYHKYITTPEELKGDGISLHDGQSWEIEESIIDLSNWSLEEIDECLGITWGSSAYIKRCLIRGAGKLMLCGCGDKEKIPLETGKRVVIIDSILEDGGRRFPEVQDGMRCTMFNCLIRNWGDPSRFNYNPKEPDRTFGAWAHAKGQICAYNCIFWQDTFWRPLRQMVLDWIRHIGQAYNDEGIKGLLKPFTYVPGVCRGLYATDTGVAKAKNCWKNHWWIALPRHAVTMSDFEALHELEKFQRLTNYLNEECHQ